MLGALETNQRSIRKSCEKQGRPPIVYITNVPFSRRDFDRYGVDWWTSQNYQVTVLDVGPFVYPQRREEWEGVVFRDESFHLQIVGNKKEFRSYKKLMAEAELIVDLTTAHGHSRWNLPVLRAISASGTPSVVMSVNAYPGYDMPLDVLQGIYPRIRHFISRLRAADPLNSVVARIPFRWFGIKPATAVVYGGKRSRRPISTVTRETIEIEGHHMDFDTFLDEIESTEAGNFAVFIDQDLGGHREFAENAAFRPFNVERYYSLLTELFSRIEARTGLEIVIAKHPHSLSEALERHMGHRRIISGKTAELIANSGLVIVHNSAAMTTAILHRKPLMVVFSKEYIDASPWNPVCHYPLIDALHRRCLYLEELDLLSDDDLFENLDVGFDDFIHDYVTAEPTRRKKLWPLIAHALHNHGVIGLPSENNQTIQSPGEL